MDQEKRIATQEEKRAFFDEQLLAPFFHGDNPLSKLLGRKILVQMDEEDKQCLLDRLMKIPELEKVMVYHTINMLVCKDEALELVKDQIALRDTKNTPTVRVMFKHLIPPTKKEGGWPCKNVNHPLIKEYHTLFNAYKKYMICGSRNSNNLAYIWEHDLPMDVAIMKSPLGKKKVMRFIIFEPYPEVQQGFNMYITPVSQKSNANTDVEMQ